MCKYSELADRLDEVAADEIDNQEGVVDGGAALFGEAAAALRELEAERDRLLLVSQSALHYLISHGAPDLDVVIRILADGLAENRAALEPQP